MTALDIHRSIIALIGAAFATSLPAQSTEFTYQGQLTQGGVPATGLYDLRIELFDHEISGSSLGTITKTATQVSDGLFTVTLDFGPGVLDGSDHWLELAVRPNGGSGITELAPRIKMTPAPYATYAGDSADSYPVGTVIDWWRPTPATPLPVGYQICDGSSVTDPASPIQGEVLPDLRGRFVMGATDGATVGESGGNAGHVHSVDLDHDHASQSTLTSGTHQHSVDLPSFSLSQLTSAAGHHDHAWLWLQNGNDFFSWNAGGSNSLMVNWGNGIGDEGSGYYPVCDQQGGTERKWYTDRRQTHQHSFSLSHDHPAVNSSQTPAHSHSVDLPALGTLDRTSGTASSLPPYHGLLKIMRVK